ncbi:MAG: hypothetical protein KI790_00600 [Cyclobacteriaceae bacterium]|nr:hypothetical protein [Cyclobacteriaceae bacterium HetDA_MAG_MS6]
MKKDIQFPEVEEVYLTIAKTDDKFWKVYIINRGQKKMDNLMITSKGYGSKDENRQATSTLRHAIPYLDAGEYALIEPIDPGVFHLNNEYWVSFFINGQLYDKKYIFVPDSIREENLSFIEELKLEGVLHP